MENQSFNLSLAGEEANKQGRRAGGDLHPDALASVSPLASSCAVQPIVMERCRDLAHAQTLTASRLTLRYTACHCTSCCFTLVQ